MVHMELRSTVVMYFGSYDIEYAIPSLYHVCMDFNEGFTRECVSVCVRACVCVFVSERVRTTYM